MQRFLDGSYWEHGFRDKLHGQVREMAAGDTIVIKSASTQRHGLPFDPEGHTISKMTLKARGVITHNPGDGQRVEVDWDPEFEPREWFFYTYRRTIWRMAGDDALARALRAFVLEDEPQDYTFFLDYWRRLVWGAKVGQGVEEASPYGVDDMLDDGVFLDRESLARALRLLHKKKNLILQGPPGTGKTFLARKLAFALLQEKADDRIAMFQFHPSTSYEDFVRGLRPTREGSFELKDGPFSLLLSRAQDDPDHDYVLIVDEINRGDLSQILGELFLLLEADKRGEKHGVTPLYPRTEREELWVPANLHLIGTMNLADRSLALVDFGLRRRFAYLTLGPQLDGEPFLKWLSDLNVPPAIIDSILSRMGEVNQLIREDRNLGPAFEVGHSFFCSPDLDEDSTGRTWLRDVFDTEVLPLLEEYWYDNPQALANARQLLFDAMP